MISALFGNFFASLRLGIFALNFGRVLPLCAQFGIQKKSHIFSRRDSAGDRVMDIEHLRGLRGRAPNWN